MVNKYLLAIIFITSFVKISLAQDLEKCSQGYLIPGKSTVNSSTYTVGEGPMSVIIGDLNNDGKSDIISSSSSEGSVSVMMSQKNKNGFWGYLEPVTTQMGKSTRGLALADLDNDGFLEIIVADFEADKVIIARSDFLGKLKEVGYISSVEPTEVVVGNFNGDSNLDIFIAERGNSFLTFHSQKLTSKFEFEFVKEIKDTDRKITSLQKSDINKDAHLDLVVLRGQYGIETFTNIFNNNFSVSGTVFKNGDTPTGMVVADMNNDGLDDILVTNFDSKNVSVYANDINNRGKFTFKRNIDVGKNPQSVIAADFNGDGTNDFCTANNFNDGIFSSYSTISLRYGKQNLSFEFSDTTLNDIEVEKNSYALASGFLDEDKRMDLVVVHKSTNVLSLLVSGQANIAVKGSSNVLKRKITSLFTGSEVSSDTYFGVVSKGKSVKKSFSIYNSGTAPLRIFGLKITSSNRGFTIINTTNFFDEEGTEFKMLKVIKPGDTYAFKIKYSPSENDQPYFSETVSISSDDCLGNFEFEVSAGPAEAKFKTIPIPIFSGTNILDVGISNVFYTGIKSIYQNISYKGLVEVKNLGYATFMHLTNAYPKGNYSFRVIFDNGNMGTFKTYVLGPVKSKGNFSPGKPEKIFPNAGRLSDLAIGDFNNDNKQDLAVLSTDQNKVLIYSGNGDGSFRKEIEEVPTGTSPGKLAIGDFDNDAIQDLAITNVSENTVTVKLGKFDGGFKDPSGIIDPREPNFNDFTPQKLSVGTKPLSIVYADFNMDGKRDLATADFDSDAITIKYATIGGKFRKVNSPFESLDQTDYREKFTVGQHPSAIAVGSFNADKFPDIITSNYNQSGSVSILLSGNDISDITDLHYDFLKKIDFPTGANPIALTYSPLGKDNENVIITANHNLQGSISVLTPEKGALVLTFQRKDYNVIKYPTSVDVSDFNGDGISDVIVSNSEDDGEVMILFGSNSENGGFDSTKILKIGKKPSSLVVGDFNGDHRMDFATASDDVSGEVTVHLGYRDPVPVLEIFANGNSVQNQDSVITADKNTLFENVEIGKSIINPFLLKNNGEDTLHITNLSFRKYDSLNYVVGNINFPIILAPGDSFPITVKYTPSLTFPESDSTILQILSDDFSNPTFEFKLKSNSLLPVFGNYTDRFIEYVHGSTIIVPSISSPYPFRHSIVISPRFKGNISVDPITGNVIVSNAYPAGTYEVRIIIDKIGEKRFKLSVGKGEQACQNFYLSTPIVSSLPSMLKNSIVKADINSDNNTDLIYISDKAVTTKEIILALGDASGKFGSQKILTTSRIPKKIFLSDVNVDGLQDILVLDTTLTNGYVEVFINKGNADFINDGDHLISDVQINNIFIIDVNHDGLNDILCSNNSLKNIYYYKADNTGKYTFTSSSSITGIELSQLADLNKDGEIDIIAVESNGNAVSAYMGTGSGGFVKSVSTFSIPSAVSFNITDFNKDEILDFAIINELRKKVYVYYGTGAVLGFVLKDSIDLKSFDSELKLSLDDLDGNLVDDIIVSGYSNLNKSNLISIWNIDTHNHYDFSFSNYVNHIVSNVNNDGFEDLLVFSNDSKIYSYLHDLGLPVLSLTGNDKAILDASMIVDKSNNTDFGKFNVGDSLNKTFKIKNIGGRVLHIDSISLFDKSSYYKLVSPIVPLDLEVNASITFDVKYKAFDTSVNFNFIRIFNNTCDSKVFTFKVVAGSTTTLPVYPAVSQMRFNVPYVIHPISGKSKVGKLYIKTDDKSNANISIDSLNGDIFISDFSSIGEHVLTISDGASQKSSIKVNVIGECDNLAYSISKKSYPDSRNEVNNYNVAIKADMNNDGIMDMFISPTGVDNRSLLQPEIVTYNKDNSVRKLSAITLDIDGTGRDIVPDIGSTFSYIIEDVNGDGKKDIIVFRDESDYYNNVGRITFSSFLHIDSLLSQDAQSNLITKPDFTITQAKSNALFTRKEDYLILTDFNGDQVPDFLMDGILMQGLGNGDFRPISNPFENIYLEINKVQMFDANRDGIKDIIFHNKIPSTTTSQISFLYGDTKGNYTKSFKNDLKTFVTRTSKTYDFNHDGNLDLLSWNNVFIIINLADSSGKYFDKNTILVSNDLKLNDIQVIYPYDYNNDGFDEIIALHGGEISNNFGIRTKNPVLSLIHLKRDYSFESIDSISVLTGNYRLNLSIPLASPYINISDLDNDGFNEIALFNLSGSQNPDLVSDAYLNFIFKKDTSQVVGPVFKLLGNNADILPSLDSASILNNTDFGNANVSSAIFTIKNDGDKKLLISSIGISGYDSSVFNLNNVVFPLEIYPGSQYDFEISYKAKLVNANYKAYLTIYTNDCANKIYKTLLKAKPLEPILGKYSDTLISNAGGNSKIYPNLNHKNASHLFVQIDNSYHGGVLIDKKDGSIQFTNAHPAGKYIVTVGAEFGVKTNFQLTVGNPSCSNYSLEYAKDSIISLSQSIASSYVFDVDNDGIQDLITVNLYSSNISFFLGNSKGTYSSSKDLLLDYPAQTLSLNDFNNDGKIDFAVENALTSSVDIYTNVGNAIFIKSTSIKLNHVPNKLFTLDLDKDGYFDLLTTDIETNNIYLTKGLGNSVYATPLLFLKGVKYNSIKFDDFNNDGNIDFIITNKGDKASIYQNVGSGKFIQAFKFDNTEIFDEVLIVDLNRNGLRDLVFSDKNSNLLMTYTNNNYFSFKSNSTVKLAGNVADIQHGDFNGDGSEDISVLNNEKSSIDVYKQDINGEFKIINTASAYPGSYSINVGDFNNDAYQDIAEFNSSSKILSVHYGGVGSINIFGNKASIFNHSNTTSISNNTSFPIGDTTVQSFTIYNSGISILRVDSLALRGKDSSNFNFINYKLPIQIKPGDSTRIYIQYISSKKSFDTTIVHLYSTDCLKSDFDFMIDAIGIPIIGNYPSSLIKNSNGNAVIFSDSLPSNIQQISAYASGNFKGLLTVDGVSGAVHITNAYPAGAYTITVHAGSGIVKQFQLTVGNPFCSLNTFKTIEVSRLSFYETIADVNKDGYQDLISIDFDYFLNIYLGNKNQNFVLISKFNLGNKPRYLLPTDINGDGNIDIIIPNEIDNSLIYSLGDGSGKFTGNYELKTYSSPTSGIISDDINSDGLKDIISYQRDGLNIFTNRGKGLFDSKTFILDFDISNHSFQRINYIDVNADGKKDLLLLDNRNAHINIFYGNDKGDFGRAPYFLDKLIPNISLPMGSSPECLLPGDFNNDGLIDLVTFNKTSLLVRFAITDTTYGNINTSNVGTSSFFPILSSADLNGDGLNEILINDGNGTTKLLSFKRNGSIDSLASLKTLGSTFGKLYVSDLNNDGHQDYFDGISISYGGLPQTYFSSGGKVELGACLGSVYNLTNSLGVTAWESTNTSIATVTPSGSLTALSIGEVYITLTKDSLGCKYQDSILISIKQGNDDLLLPISGKSNICENSKTIFSSNVQNGVWESDNPLVAQVDQNGAILGIKFGVATIRYSVTINGVKKSGTRIIKVNKLPNISIENSSNSLCENNNLLKVIGAPKGEAIDIKWMQNGKIVYQAPTTQSTVGVTVVGGNGSGNALNQVISPKSFDIDQAGNIYVLDGANGRVQKWEKGAAVGKVALTLPGFTDNNAYASQISVDPYGTIYLLDNPNSIVKKYDITNPSGIKVADFKSSTFSLAKDMAIDASGYVYVLTTSAGLVSRVDKWSNNEITCSKESKVVAGDKGLGGRLDQLISANTIMTDDSSNIYVGDISAARITKFDQTDPLGSVVTNFPTITNFQLDPAGNVYVSDFYDKRILKFPKNDITKSIVYAGGNGSGSAANQIDSPFEIKFDESGNLYVADGNNNRIQRWDAPRPDTSYSSSVYGEYKAIVTNFMGCSIESNSILVNPQSSVSSSSKSNQIICSGSEIEPIVFSVPSSSKVSFENLPIGISGELKENQVSIKGNSSTSGVYTYKVRIQTACLDTTLVGNISVIAANLPSEIFGPSTICIGSQIQLSNSVESGLWMSSDPTIIAINSKGQCFGVKEGTASISYSILQNGCKSSVSKLISVTESVSLGQIQGVNSICLGNSSKLSMSSVKGIWTSLKPDIASVDSFGLVKSLKSGIAVIRFESGDIGCTSQVQKELTIESAPSIISNESYDVCVGSALKIPYSAKSGVWVSTDSLVVSVDQNGLALAISSGNADVFFNLYSDNQCPSSIIKSSFTVKPLFDINPIEGDSSVCLGNKIILSNSTLNGTWSSSNSGIASISNTGQVTALESGTVTIGYTVSRNGCTKVETKLIKVLGLEIVSAIEGDSVVCKGGKIKLSSSTQNGKWASASPSNITIDSIGNVQGIKAGKSIISYTVSNASGCLTTVTKELTVPSDPQIVSISSNVVCLGDSKQMSIATLGGVWSSSKPSIATVDSNGVVKAISTGSSDILYSVNASNGCIASVFKSAVEVPNVPVPDIITGNSSICSGSTLVLAESTIGGVWSTSNITVATIQQNGTVTALSAGTSEVLYTLSVNGCKSSASKIITVKQSPTPPLVSNISYCKSALTSPLEAKIDPTNSVLWYGNNASGGNSTVLPPTPASDILGDYNYYVSQKNIQNGCESQRSKVVISINPIPVQPTITRDGAGNLFSSAVNGNQWFSGGIIIPNINSQTFKPTSSGYYSVVTTEKGCLSNPSDSYYYLVTSVVNFSNGQFIKYYPNPVQSYLMIDFNLTGANQIELKIYDITGKLLIDRKNVTKGAKIQLSGISQGTYRIQLLGKNGKLLLSDKFLKN